MRSLSNLTAALVSGACLLGACSEDPRSVPLSDGTVDTFEDGNTASNVGTQWEGVSEGNPGGGSIAVTIQRGGFSSIAFALAVNGLRGEGATAQTTTGVRLPLTQGTRNGNFEDGEITTDLDGFTGLALALKGRPGTYIVQLGSALITDFNFYNAYVEVGENWTEFKIPFANFKQESYGAQIPWSGKEIKHIAIYTSAPGDIAFGVDDVRFY